MKQAEDLLAKEMTKLSVQERAAAFDDVHCVGEEHQETPEMVQKALADFEQAVQKENHPIYEFAVNQDRSFVEDPTFRLKFLRANFFDIEKSVRQMMDFLFYKAKYFGQDKVAREITVSDLTEDDLRVMLSGLYHIQEGRDRMGRVIVYLLDNEIYLLDNNKMNEFDAAIIKISPAIFVSFKYACFVSVRSFRILFHSLQCKPYITVHQIRVSYYVWWNVVSNIPDAQTKGTSSINHFALRMPDLGFLREIIPFLNSLPRRMSVVHCCVQTASAGNTIGSSDGLFRFALASIPHYLRVRSRIHSGSSMEIQYQLQSHGIPADDTFPLDKDGNPREHRMMNLWFEKHLHETNQTAPIQLRVSNVAHSAGGLSDEAQRVNFNNDIPLLDQVNAAMQHQQQVQEGVVIIPTDNDVLMGKGWRLQSHPGNVRFRFLLEAYQEEYDNCRRRKRRDVSAKLAHSLRASGIRFLEQNPDNGKWSESSMEEVGKKVGQGLRELRKKSKR